MATQYYLFDPETSMYIDTNYFENQPVNSVDFPPKVQTEFAKLNDEKQNGLIFVQLQKF